MSDDQHLVTSELVQVLHSKQTRIDELEQRLKHVEQQESQWKVSERPGTLETTDRIVCD